MRLPRILLRVCLIALLVVANSSFAHAAEKPKIRAITAFVRLDPAQMTSQIAETLAMLRSAKSTFAQAGYEIQTLRITPQPFAVFAREMSREKLLAFYADYAAIVKKEGFASAIGPVSFRDEVDLRLVDLYAEILAAHSTLDGSIIVAGEDGVYWNAVRAGARIMKYLEEHTPRSQGNFNFAAAAMVEAYTPFYPASYHLGGGRQFAVAIQGASLVDESFSGAKQNFDAAGKALAALLAQHGKSIQDIGKSIEKQTGWSYMGLDISTAPLKDVSIGAAIEKLTGAPFGAPGTMAAAALITGVLKNAPVSHAGYSGLMLPVLEDSRLAQRWSEGILTLDALLSYSAICGTGLDTIPLPGDVAENQLARIVGDMASLAVKLSKPLTARLMPVKGKKPGELTEFDDPFIVNARLQPLP
jgi:hypothetical protein